MNSQGSVVRLLPPELRRIISVDDHDGLARLVEVLNRYDELRQRQEDSLAYRVTHFVIDAPSIREGLRWAIRDHGPITEETVESAVKRVRETLLQRRKVWSDPRAVERARRRRARDKRLQPPGVEP